MFQLSSLPGLDDVSNVQSVVPAPQTQTVVTTETNVNNTAAVDNSAAPPSVCICLDFACYPARFYSLVLFLLLCWLCASGCAAECRICNQEVAGSNLGLGYFTPRSTQPSVPPGLVNEYQLWLQRQRQVWLTPLADEMQGVQENCVIR